MGKQYNKVEKRRRRHRYLKRKADSGGKGAARPAAKSSAKQPVAAT